MRLLASCRTGCPKLRWRLGIAARLAHGHGAAGDEFGQSCGKVDDRLSRCLGLDRLRFSDLESVDLRRVVLMRVEIVETRERTHTSAVVVFGSSSRRE